MKENHLEDACLEWLADLGWSCVQGDAVSPGSQPETRARYSDVVLVPRLRAAIERLNPALSLAEIDEAVTKVAMYGAQSVVDANQEIYDWLRNGVPLEITEDDGRRTVRRVQVIDFTGTNDLLAIRCIRAAHLNGLRVPHDLAVVGFDGIALGEDLTPALSTVMQPNDDIGRRAVELLVQALEQALWETFLLHRSSVLH